MIALIQRVRRASVTIAHDTQATIEAGVLALIAAERDDDSARAERLGQRIVDYRVFADERGRMNHSVRATGGAVLAVPQFTLAADTRRGNRPGFSHAACPERAEALFARCVAAMRGVHEPVETGVFGADMQVALVNDGPVTFWLSC